MTEKKREKERGAASQLLGFAGERKALSYLGCALSAVAMLLSFGPYICIWKAAAALIAVAPDWTEAEGLVGYGWAALAFSVASIALYFAALMCCHLAAFRCASNMRKKTAEHLMHVPLGHFSTHASGELRRVIDGCASATESYLAHMLPDAAGSVAMVLGTLVLLFVFDWRLGLACFAAIVASALCLASMMSREGMEFMRRYQEALVHMNKTGTEYVRGIPVVKVFQQTVYSFKAFREAIEEYSQVATDYALKACKIPQSLNLTVLNGVVIFLVPLVVLLAPGEADLAHFATNVAFYAVFSALVPTALMKLMFMANFSQTAVDALARVKSLLDAPVLEEPAAPEHPRDASVAFEHVSFSYGAPGEDGDASTAALRASAQHDEQEGGGDGDQAAEPKLPLALDDVSFTVPAGATVALVGPSGGGKTTAASLIPRFWDAGEGVVRVGGVDVRNIGTHELMSRVAFVFQENKLFADTLLENVRAARPDATEDEVSAALEAAQCDDIVAKLPDGLNTRLGAGGAYLSGGEVQRVALARAILKDAPIVVLDEATAFADPENEALIQKAFARLAEGKTVVMIAHRLSTVVNADKIVVLDSGHVAEQGTHAELLAKGGLYARMWDDYNKAATWRIEASGCGRSASSHERGVQGYVSSGDGAEMPCPEASKGGEAAC